MSREDFYDRWEELATSVGQTFSTQLRFKGWDRDDAQQTARMKLWQLAGDERIRMMDSPRGYLIVSMRREVGRRLSRTKPMFSASHKQLAALLNDKGVMLCGS